MSVEATSSNQPENSNPPAEEPDSGWGWIGFGFMILVCIWLVYVGAGTYLIPAYRAQYVYIQTEAIVLETDLDVGVNKGEEVCHPRIRLRYDANGEIQEEWTFLNWAEPVSSSRQRAETDLQGYPVGGTVTAWYDPAKPARVVVARDVGFALGWLIVGVGLLVPAFLIGLALVGLVFQARKDWFVLEETTGRVVSGEIREITQDEQAVFQAVLHVQYDRNAAGYPGTITTGILHLQRAEAEQELSALLSAYPIGEEKPIWYNPYTEEEPSFEPRLTLGTFLAAAVVTMLWPLLATAVGVFQFCRWMWWKLTHFRSAPSTRPVVFSSTDQTQTGANTTPEDPRAQRVMAILISLFVIGFLGWFVFRQDYQCYFTFRKVTGKVMESHVVPGGADHFQPKVKFCYTLDDCYVERWTHNGWIGPRLTRISREEAESLIAPFPPGTEVTVWCNPVNPGMGVIKQYTRWYFYPLIIPPLWLLVVQTRRLLRRE